MAVPWPRSQESGSPGENQFPGIVSFRIQFFRFSIGKNRSSPPVFVGKFLKYLHLDLPLQKILSVSSNGQTNLFAAGFLLSVNGFNNPGDLMHGHQYHRFIDRKNSGGWPERNDPSLLLSIKEFETAVWR